MRQAPALNPPLHAPASASRAMHLPAGVPILRAAKRESVADIQTVTLSDSDSDYAPRSVRAGSRSRGARRAILLSDSDSSSSPVNSSTHPRSGAVAVLRSGGSEGTARVSQASLRDHP